MRGLCDLDQPFVVSLTIAIGSCCWSCWLCRASQTQGNKDRKAQYLIHFIFEIRNNESKSKQAGGKAILGSFHCWRCAAALALATSDAGQHLTIQHPVRSTSVKNLMINASSLALRFEPKEYTRAPEEQHINSRNKRRNQIIGACIEFIRCQGNTADRCYPTFIPKGSDAF